MRKHRPAASGRRGRRALKAGFVSFCVLAMSVFGAGVAHAAAPVVDCSGVFSGKTPDPIQKSADKTTAVPGESVTYTVTWHSTGVATADVTDCFQVDDGSNAVLNALVTVSNVETDVTNAGPDGTLQTLTFSVAIPNDPLLIGHTVNDRVKITHGSAESRSETVGVSVVAPPNQAPSVSCPTMTVDGLTVSYTANASDSDGTITNYHWVFGDGSTADTATGSTSHTYATGGSFNVSVTVTDNDGATSSAGPCSVTVTAPPPENVPPTVSCPTMTVDGLTVGYTANASDSDGTITNYHWVFGDGSTADTATATTSHTYATGGSFNVSVTVTDNDGATASAGPCPVTVTAPVPQNQAPVVSCPTMTVDGLSVSYSVSASDPDGGAIASYHWVFGDGTTADTALPTTTHVYASSGTKQVSVTVTDNDGGATATAGPCPVTVTAPPVPNQPPVVSCPTMSVDGLDVSYSVVASDPDGGAIASYHWVFGDGSSVDTTAPSTTHSYSADGSYDVSVTVTDNDGGLTASAGPCRVTVAAPVVVPVPSSGGPVVLGEKKRLPKTGAGVGSLALLGAVMLMAGAVLTRVKIRPVREVFAGSGQVAQMVEAFGQRLLMRGTRMRTTTLRM